MAIDTRDRRFAILGLDDQATGLPPNPDGTVATADRAMWLHLYQGIALSGASSAIAVIVSYLRRRRTS